MFCCLILRFFLAGWVCKLFVFLSHGWMDRSCLLYNQALYPILAELLRTVFMSSFKEILIIGFV